jgi:hypothetical protein
MYIHNLQIENNVKGSKERHREKYFKNNKNQDKTSQIFDAVLSTVLHLLIK